MDRTRADHRLAADAARGDDEAFAALVGCYRRYIYAIAYRIVLNEEDALDVSQNVLLKLARRIGQFDRRGPFRAWLAAIAAHEVLSHRRRPEHREAATDPEDLARLAVDGRTPRPPSPRDALERSERLERVERAMARLTPQQRAIFQMRLAEQMRPREIARRMDIPAAQVRSQLSRALATLRRTLELEEKR